MIASLLFKEYGKNAFQVATWLKENSIRPRNAELGKGWWSRENDNGTLGAPSLSEMMQLHMAAMSGDIDVYNKVLKAAEFEESVSQDLEDSAHDWRIEIRRVLFKQTFFNKTIIRDLKSGKLENPKQYKGMSLKDAADKYDEKRVFDDQEPLKTYKNGYKWINVGPKCQLVGSKMKNCGSAGVMSSDPDKTIFTLFDKENNPHVVVTHSPNDKRISGDEGKASTAVKKQYHSYILDLAKTLGAEFDHTRTKSKHLKIMGMLKDYLAKIKSLNYKSDYHDFYEFELKDGRTYYTDSFSVAKKEDVDSNLKDLKDREDYLVQVFNGRTDVERLALQTLVTNLTI